MTTGAKLARVRFETRSCEGPVYSRSSNLFSSKLPPLDSLNTYIIIILSRLQPRGEKRLRRAASVSWLPFIAVPDLSLLQLTIGLKPTDPPVRVRVESSRRCGES